MVQAQLTRFIRKPKRKTRKVEASPAVKKHKKSTKKATRKVTAKTTKSRKVIRGLKKIKTLEELIAYLNKVKKKGWTYATHKSKYRGRERFAYVIRPVKPKTYKSKSFLKEMKKYSKDRDAKRKALPAGLRVILDPKTGKVLSVYYEYRLNRADALGSTI